MEVPPQEAFWCWLWSRHCCSRQIGLRPEENMNCACNYNFKTITKTQSAAKRVLPLEPYGHKCKRANKQTFSCGRLTPRGLADADAGYNLAIVARDRLDGGRSEQNMNCALHNVQTRSMIMHFLKTEQNGVCIRIGDFQHQWVILWKEWHW